MIDIISSWTDFICNSLSPFLTDFIELAKNPLSDSEFGVKIAVCFKADSNLTVFS